MSKLIQLIDLTTTHLKLGHWICDFQTHISYTFALPTSLINKQVYIINVHYLETRKMFFLIGYKQLAKKNQMNEMCSS